MRKYLIMAALAVILPWCAPAFAQEPVASKSAAHGGQIMGQRTLAQEKALLRKRMDRLDKMTEEQWEARKKARAERREKWQKMSPEEKAAAKEKWKDRFHKKNAEPTAAPVVQ